MDVKWTSKFFNLVWWGAESLSSNLDIKMKKVKLHVSRTKKYQIMTSSMGVVIFQSLNYIILILRVIMLKLPNNTLKIS